MGALRPPEKRVIDTMEIVFPLLYDGNFRLDVCF
jgi:hypothetical protein